MRRRLMLLLFFAWVAVDLASPLVPGAFSFDPGQCVDGVSRHRDRPVGMDTLVVARTDAPRLGPVLRAPAPLPMPARPPTWRPHVARDHAIPPADGAFTDDD